MNRVETSYTSACQKFAVSKYDIVSTSDEAMDKDSRLIKASVRFAFATARVGFQQERTAVSVEETSVTVRMIFNNTSSRNAA